MAEPDPRREPILQKRTSPILKLILLALVLAAAGVGTFYFTRGRLPHAKDVQEAAGKTGEAVKDLAGQARGKAEDLMRGCPIELTTLSAENSTTVVVTLKSSALDELKEKYVKVRVKIPQLEIDSTAGQSEWPVIARKALLANRTAKLEELAATVWGIDTAGKPVELYRR
jgi:hypothetical protein